MEWTSDTNLPDLKAYVDTLAEIERLLVRVGYGQGSAEQMRAISSALEKHNVFPTAKDSKPVKTVECDQDSGMPMAAFVEDRRIEIQRVIAFIGDPRAIRLGERNFGRPRFGQYVVETAGGVCKLEASPHLKPDSTEDRGQVDWSLVVAEPLEAPLRLWASGKFDLPKAGQAVGPEQEEKVRRRNREVVRLVQGCELNVKAYEEIFKIEARLRLFIWENLSKKYEPTNGRKWWKAVIPEDVRNYIEENVEKVKTYPWIEVPDNNPLAYTTLSNLRVIIEERKVDFEPVLRPLAVLLGDMVTIETIRNHVAHNRAITEGMWGSLVDAIRRVHLGLGRRADQ